MVLNFKGAISMNTQKECQTRTSLVYKISWLFQTNNKTPSRRHLQRCKQRW